MVWSHRVGRDDQQHGSPRLEPPLERGFFPLAIDAWLDRVPAVRRRGMLAELVRADAVLTARCAGLYPDAEPVARLAQLLLHVWARAVELDPAEIAMLLADVGAELEAGLARLIQEGEYLDEGMELGEAIA